MGGNVHNQWEMFTVLFVLYLYLIHEKYIFKFLLLGSNFCHDNALWHRSIYFGDINVSNNPGKFWLFV